MDPDTLLNLLKKLSGMIEHIGSPADLDHHDTAEHTTFLTSSYFENELRLTSE